MIRSYVLECTGLIGERKSSTIVSEIHTEHLNSFHDIWLFQRLIPDESMWETTLPVFFLFRLRVRIGRCTLQRQPGIRESSKMPVRPCLKKRAPLTFRSQAWPYLHLRILANPRLPLNPPLKPCKLFLPLLPFLCRSFVVPASTLVGFVEHPACCVVFNIPTES